MLQTTYTVTEKDLRAAMYYPYLFRYKRGLWLLMLATALSLVWFLAARLGLCRDLYPLYFIAIGYLFYMAVVFGRAEESMRRCLRAPDCLLGQKYALTLDAGSARFCVEAKKIDETLPLSSLYMVADMKDIFLFHLKDAQVYIVPKRAFAPEALSSAVSLLQAALKERYTVFRLFPQRGGR